MVVCLRSRRYTNDPCAVRIPPPSSDNKEILDTVQRPTGSKNPTVLTGLTGAPDRQESLDYPTTRGRGIVVRERPRETAGPVPHRWRRIGRVGAIGCSGPHRSRHRLSRSAACWRRLRCRATRRVGRVNDAVLVVIAGESSHGFERGEDDLIRIECVFPGRNEPGTIRARCRWWSCAGRWQRS